MRGLFCVLAACYLSLAFSFVKLRCGHGRLGAIQATSLSRTLESLQSPSDRLVKAMSRENAQKLSVSDGMKISGLTQEEVQRDLMLLSSITKGTIEVDEDGELIYSFPKDFGQILREKNLGTKLREVKEKVAPPLMYATRVSFGILLITSLVIVSVAAMSAVGGGSSSSSGGSDKDERDNSRRGGGRGGGLTMNFFSGPDMFDFFYYRPRYGYYYYNDAYSMGRRDPEKVGFFEMFFSFVFGDGDPNTNFNERRLQRIAEVIRSKDGVVVAEDLAPYLDPPYAPLSAIQEADADVKPNISREQLDLSIAKSESSVVDESWVLPAVLQFGGVPAVTEKGNVYYRFDQLRKSLSATDSTSTNGGGEVKAWETEQEIPFSRAAPWQKVAAGGLGAVNFVGVTWLGTILARMGSMSRDAMALRALYPFLLIYAVTYVTIPLFRSVDLKQKNERIKQNNTNRMLWSLFAQKALSEDFVNKVKDVSSYSDSTERRGPRKILYTTEVEQEEDDQDK